MQSDYPACQSVLYELLAGCLPSKVRMGFASACQQWHFVSIYGVYRPIDDAVYLQATSYLEM